MELKELLEHWIAIKEQEKETSAWRRDIEDQIIHRLQLQDLTKNKTKEVEGYKVVASTRIDKKVDVETVQEIAKEHDLRGYLRNLFRWKAEVNSRAWEKADPEITAKLQNAITEKQSRISFKIEKKNISSVKSLY